VQDSEKPNDRTRPLRRNDVDQFCEGVARLEEVEFPGSNLWG